MAVSIISQLTIEKIIRETPNAKTFVLGFTDEMKADYVAGQFLTLVFYTRNGEKRRSYSISSAPLAGEPLAITTKKVDNGEFSRLLLTRSKVGDVLYSSGISGQFILPATPGKFKTYVFIAAGSGITPCFSLIKTLLLTTDCKVILIYSNRSQAETIFYDALQNLNDKFRERFQIKYLFSELADIYNSRLSNWLLEKLLEQFGIEPQQTLFYVCGPFEYMRTVEISLLTKVPKEHIYKENFSTLPVITHNKPPDTRMHNVTIHINGNEHKLKVQYPQSILAAAKQNRIELPYSCEAGRCSSCSASLIKGKVWMANNEVLTDAEIQKGRILVCQSFPVDGDVEIDYLS